MLLKKLFQNNCAQAKQIKYGRILLGLGMLAMAVGLRWSTDSTQESGKILFSLIQLNSGTLDFTTGLMLGLAIALNAGGAFLLSKANRNNNN